MKKILLSPFSCSLLFLSVRLAPGTGLPSCGSVNTPTHTTLTHTHTHTLTHTLTYTRTPIHAYIHTHSHTHTVRGNAACFHTCAHKRGTQKWAGGDPVFNPTP